MEKKSKVFTALVAKTIRDTIRVAQEYNLSKEDIVNILKDEREGYVVFCYI